MARGSFHPSGLLLLAFIVSVSLVPLYSNVSVDALQNVVPGATVDSDITTDTTWDPSGSPYIITTSINVTAGATLTIQHGTEVHFAEGTGLIVMGRLDAGDYEGTITFRPQTGNLMWKGIRFEGASTCVLEGASISYASTSLDLNSSGIVWARNCTFLNDNVPLRLDNSSRAGISNSTLSWGSVKMVDDGSSLMTYSLLSGLTVDHTGAPRGGLRVEVFDRNEDLMLSYLVNDTGEVPPFLLQGATIKRTGTDPGPGTYLVSLSDDPFTHYVNHTYVHNGTKDGDEVWRFNWPPTLSRVPSFIRATEDHPTYFRTEILDRNGVGSVTMDISSVHVTYDDYNMELRFFYKDEEISNETVVLTLDDGYDVTVLSFEVNVTFWPDAPTLDIDNRFVKVVEDVVSYVSLAIDDEDSPLSELEVTTEDPTNITYIPGNTTLAALYPDGAPSQFEVNVSVSDGTSTATKTLVFTYTGVFYPPYFRDLPTELVLTEDTARTFDLTQFIHDDDLGETVYLRAQTMAPDLFSVGVASEDPDNITTVHRVLISPIKDAFGSGKVLLVLTDEGGLNTSATCDVRIDPVNDAPLLLSPRMEMIGTGFYRFLITFLDVDGDEPVDLFVSVDGTLLPMTEADPADRDITDGKEYKAELELEPGEHSYSFIGSDGIISRTLDGGSFNTPEVLLYDELQGYDGRLGVSMITIGKGPSPTITSGMTVFGSVPGMVFLGCSFRVDLTGRVVRDIMVILETLEFRDDIIPQTTRLYISTGTGLMEGASPYYNRTTGILSVTLDGPVIGRNLSFWAELDPDLDSDGDGVPNFLDRFPEDRNEWNDTDSDGIGDNADDDDDNDGFPDIVEIAAGTNPRSAASYPKDTDNDGILDHLDDDDDGDGMPDEWELRYGLDPLDPSDASLDPDKDGATNLQEHLRGTHPFVYDGTAGSKGNAYVIVPVIAVLLVLLIIAAVLVVRANRRPTFELDEGRIETSDDEWEVQGELDREDALECSECGEYYPYWENKCPFCGTKSTMEAED